MHKKKSINNKGLPKHIDIVCNKDTVVLDKDLQDAFGMCDRHKKVIHLLNSDSYNIAEVLLHEIFHAIWYEYGIKSFTRLNEEQMVNCLGLALTLVMSSPKNKALRNFFNKEWSK